MAEKGIAIGGVLSERYTFFEIAKVYARDGQREQALNALERANISERYHQHSAFPDDARKWIAPRIPVELSSKDYFANRDPALEAVLAVVREECAGRSCISP